ncbi:MAG: hypothetical protein LBL34_00040 [Clostridiales bacterium]|jgi:hypothetical protein|nr:hypothetical protein [Clostridiales bacterium]
MGTLDVGMAGVGAKEAIRGLLARFSSKKKLERSKEMDDVMEAVVELDIEKDILRDRIASYSSDCFYYVRELGRPGDESHPILKIWAEKIQPMEDLAFGCKTIEQVDAMHKQLKVYAKETRDIYNKESQAFWRPTR